MYVRTIHTELTYPPQHRLLDGADHVSLSNPLTLGVIVLYLLIPVAMTVLLARRFSEASRRLRAQLEWVQELSERTLTQERGKTGTDRPAEGATGDRAGHPIRNGMSQCSGGPDASERPAFVIRSRARSSAM